jgi:hypothetical protein
VLSRLAGKCALLHLPKIIAVSWQIRVRKHIHTTIDRIPDRHSSFMDLKFSLNLIFTPDAFDLANYADKKTL